MAVVQIVESTQEFASSGGAVNYNITALDDQNNSLGSTFVVTPVAGAVWGAFNWGAGNWAASMRIPHVYIIPWPNPLVSQKLAIDIAASSSNSLSIGTFFARYQDAGYTVQR